MLEQVYLDETVAHVQPMLKQFVKDGIPLEGPSQEYLEECDKKKVAERSCYRLIPAAISCILTPLRERSQD